ncbi:formyltransferase family protein [Pedobacter sp. FW305-3-2-15-E-R2A2]|uniref:methionyl-tRNA formyltransferase n=1 Tax=Pedobacter sp. FW305-3-2-15-E-R2A2 TaxID=3140251 RepID=UPI0031401F26
MKIIIFTSSSLFVKTVSGLTSHCVLAGIVIPEDYNYDLSGTIQYAETNNIPLLRINKDDLQTEGKLASWMSALQAAAALVMTFPFKIPEHILTLPEKGIFNVHFSKLPAYKGSAPLFWQLKNGESQSCLTVHQMTPSLDEGPVVFSQDMPFMSGENYGIAKARLTQLLAQNLGKIIQAIAAGKYNQPLETTGESFFKSPEISDLTIQWNEQTAEEIENLVNAANPLYNGAITTMNGQELRILEVSQMNVEFNPGTTLPGTVFHVDPHHGPIVLTTDQKLLLINILETPEGIFSGKKICAMGLKAGDQFLNLN